MWREIEESQFALRQEARTAWALPASLRGEGEWPRPFAVAGVFDPERKNSRDRAYCCNYLGSAPYSPIGVRGCDRTEVCIMLTRRFLLLGGAIGAAADRKSVV